MTSTVPEWQLTAVKKDLLREFCLSDHLFFTRYFFKARENRSFIVNWHHKLIADKLQDVIGGKIVNLVINVPPGGSKTEMVVINLIARGLAINHRARFLHLSYSDDLASLNSSSARDLVQSEAYQELFERPVSKSSKSRKRWNVTLDDAAMGSVYATATGGQVTGFRAGHMAPGFQGAMIIDDPLKPEDAFSEPMRETANRKILSTLKSRKALPTTPTVLIMQRLAATDPTGFIQEGNVPGEWHHVVIPACMTDAEADAFGEPYASMIDRSVRDVHNRFSYWEAKEPVSELNELENGKALDDSGNPIGKYVFYSQYQQNPRPLGGRLVHSAWFPRYDTLPPLRVRFITVDTAQKTGERNDYTVFAHWGVGRDDKKLYLIGLQRDRYTAPELRRMAVDFWTTARELVTVPRSTLRCMYIEDKSSGTGLIQDLAHAKKPSERVIVRPVERSIDKLTRWMDMIPSVELGDVLLPSSAAFVLPFLNELESLNAMMTHAFDDQADVLADAVEIGLRKQSGLSLWETLG